MDQLKQIEEKVVEIKTNLDSFRKTADENTEHVKKYGAEHGDLKERTIRMEADMTKAVGQIVDLQRAIAMANAQKSGDGELTAAQREQKAAIVAYLRKGDKRGALTDAEEKALSTLSNPDGGYTVVSDNGGRMVEKVYADSPMRAYANVQAITTDALEGVIDNDEADAGWVGEVSDRPETDTPQIGKWRIPVHEMYAKPKATQTLLDDSAINIEAWLQGKVNKKFGRKESLAFISGSGVGQPRGILSQTLATTDDDTRAWGTVQYVKSGVNQAFAAVPNGGDLFIDLITKLHPKYHARAVFLMNRVTLGATMKLKDSDGSYIWMPDFTQGSIGLVKGFKVDASFDFLPNYNASVGAKAIAFGDFMEAYQIVDRQGIRVLRDPFSSKPFIEFYSTKRVGGDVLNYEAYKLASFEA